LENTRRLDLYYEKNISETKHNLDKLEIKVYIPNEISDITYYYYLAHEDPAKNLAEMNFSKDGVVRILDQSSDKYPNMDALVLFNVDKAKNKVEEMKEHALGFYLREALDQLWKAGSSESPHFLLGFLEKIFESLCKLDVACSEHFKNVTF
jgi:hypothetical protein